MAGFVTYTAVLLLARKRLERVRTLLRAKVLSGGPVNEIDRQILFLANKALEALNSQPSPPPTNFPVDSFTPWLAQGISKFAVMGTFGPEIPKFAAMFAPSQSWFYDTLGAGNPDPARQQVRNRSTDFLIEFWGQVSAAILANPPGPARDAKLARMRAYALGHACHLASAMMSAPYISSVEWQLGEPGRAKLTGQAVRGAIEAGVAMQVYGRNDARGHDWNLWLPTPDEVPDEFFSAYSAAAEQVYGPGARVAGSKAFNDRLAADDPPPLSADLIRDGYGAYRLLTEQGYAWEYSDWLWATLFMFIPPALMFPLSLALPKGRDVRRDSSYFAGKPPFDRARALFEALNFPLAANCLVPLATTLWLTLGTYKGLGTETIWGLISGGVVLAAAIVFFATLNSGIDSSWALWLFVFAIPLALELVHVFLTLRRGGRDMKHWQLAMSSVAHIGIAIFFVVAFLAWQHVGVEAAADDGLGSGKFWLHAVLWAALVAVLWLVSSALLYTLNTSMPGIARNDFVTGQKHYLRLFDDTALATGPVGAPPPTLADLLFPEERRPLLKLWWTGAGDLFVRSHRDALSFAFSQNPAAPDIQLVLAPIAPMTAAEYGQLLKKTVKDNAGNFSGQLTVERFAADEPFDAQLPAGAVFADHGDDKTTAVDHDVEALKYRKVPAAGQDPYILYSAPRDAQAILMGQAGAVLPPDGKTAVGSAVGVTASVALATLTLVTGSPTAQFLDTFVPGDVIDIGGQKRVVVSIDDDLNLTVSSAFGGAIAAGPFSRPVRDREDDLTGAVAVGTIGPDPGIFRQVLGAGTTFDAMFMPGDVIRAMPGGGTAENRIVVAVLSATQLTIDAPFSSLITAGTRYVRPGRLSAQGYSYAPVDPTPVFAGNSVLDRAADLATLLCLGLSSHIVPDADRRAVPGPHTPLERHGPINKAHQVFRNWNLNQRRVNEWRMLVTGNAVSEKHGQADRADALQPGVPAAWRTPAAAGEPIANALGWAPLFIKWLDMAHRPANDTTEDTVFREGNPTNLQLSRGVAYLLDLPSPV